MIYLLRAAFLFALVVGVVQATGTGYFVAAFSGLILIGLNEVTSQDK